MAQYLFRLPDIGEGVAEAEITAWHVKVGDHVKEDGPLLDVMTDKATVDMSSPVEGVITALHGSVGSMAPVGSVLVEMDVAGDEGQLQPLVVEGLDEDAVLRAANGDGVRVVGQPERIRGRAEVAKQDLVRGVRGELDLLPHVVLELVRPPVDLDDVRAEVDHHGDDQQGEQTAQGARAATMCHQLLCTPSTIFCTILEMACLRPSCSARSA